MRRINPLFLTDSYKVGHWKMLPEGTTNAYAHFASRGSRGDRLKETTFFGLQYTLMEYLLEPITYTDVMEADLYFRQHFGRDLMNFDGWMHIITDHRGHLPLAIRAVPEGTVVPTKNALFTVENTCPQCAWVTGYVEGILEQTWYGTTVASISREAKKIILRYLEQTGTPELIDYKLHDFGFRGVSSVESSAIGGAAHLVNFKGTDTLMGLVMARDYYRGGCPGHSVAATEHSVMTINGEDGEFERIAQIVDAFPSGILSMVSDSYDITRVLDVYLPMLKDTILARDGKLVIRPDSGYPPHMVVACLRSLGETFGYTVNDRGYKLLSPKVGVIQGDGLDLDMIDEVCLAVKVAGWSIDNVTFGMGGGLLQKCDRDTFKVAYKLCSAVVNGERRDVVKKPVTDLGKASMGGRMALVSIPGQGYKTVDPHWALQNGLKDELVEVYRDGKLKNLQTFEEIRQRASMPVQVLLPLAR